jgi:hypothetical protein
MAATAPAKPKFTPAPMKRPTEVQKAKAVARASHVPYAGAHDMAVAIVPKIDFQIEIVPAEGTQPAN